jgi:GMP synthase (glutamine-hydrolysing)
VTAALRCLVVEGNVRAAREAHARDTGRMPCESYADALAAVAAGLGAAVACDLAFPADEGANLPDPAGLSGYDAVVLTGSALAVYRVEPAVARQVDLMRAVYASGTPAFGSCWGLQVGAVAAGGAVAPSPAGPEVGFARRIVRSEAGHGHPLLDGRPAAWDAPAVHLDAVTVPPGGCTVLARNDRAAVQAAEIRHDGGTFWGVQYHPEFSLADMADIIGRYGRTLVDEGPFIEMAQLHANVADLRLLDEDPTRADVAWRLGYDADVLDEGYRTTEIRNWITHMVEPEMTRRGRG